MIDWKAIFVKYVRIVYEAEGFGYLDSEDWTEEEWKAIKEATGWK